MTRYVPAPREHSVETIALAAARCLPVSLLSRVARGEVDMVTAARNELARRGLNLDGEMRPQTPTEKHDLTGAMSRFLRTE